MIGVQFVQVGNNNDSLDLATVGVLDSSMSGFDEDGEFKTEMRIWNGNGYTTYGWSGSSGTDIMEDASYDNKWLDNQTEIPENEYCDPSSGFWIKAEKAGTMTISGQVSTGDLTIDLAAGFNLVANPYPQDVLIADFGTLDATMSGFDEDGEFKTELRVWNGNGYTTYGWSGTSGTDIMEDASYDNKWLDNQTEISTEKIPFGHAVWIKAEKAGKITFKLND